MAEDGRASSIATSFAVLADVLSVEHDISKLAPAVAGARNQTIVRLWPDWQLHCTCGVAGLVSGQHSSGGKTRLATRHDDAASRWAVLLRLDEGKKDDCRRSQ